MKRTILLTTVMMVAAGTLAAGMGSSADRGESEPATLEDWPYTAFLTAPFFWTYLPSLPAAEPLSDEVSGDRDVSADPGNTEPDDLPIASGEFVPHDGSPRVDDYGNGGCLLDDQGNPFWPCGDDEFEFTAAPSTLYVLHLNAAYNCCPDDIVISLTLEEDLIRLDETEILTEPCYCICCYDVDATVVNLDPGEYTVEFYWFDYDTDQIQCYVEGVVIP